LKRGLSVQDEGTRDAITAQLQQHALLTRKMNSIKNDSSSSDESSDDDDEDDDGSNLEAKLLNKGKEKIRKVVEEDNAIPKSGVFSLPFMVRFQFYIVFLLVHWLIKCHLACVYITAIIIFLLLSTGACDEKACRCNLRGDTTRL
jgi:hypothetical protein